MFFVLFQGHENANWRFSRPLPLSPELGRGRSPACRSRRATVLKKSFSWRWGLPLFWSPWPKQKDENRVRVENTGEGKRSQGENQRLRGEKGAIFFLTLAGKKRVGVKKKQGGKIILPILNGSCWAFFCDEGRRVF